MLHRVPSLTRLKQLTARRATIRQRDRDTYHQWRDEIATLATSGVPAVDIAAAAGITPTRVAQIRDGQR